MALQSMTALASITLQQASSSVTFTSIPQNYRDLILVIQCTTVVAGNYLLPRVNNDSGSNYSRVIMYGTGSTTGSLSSTTSSIDIGQAIDSSVPANFVIQFMDYSATDKHKIILARTNTTTGTNGVALAGAYRWASTSAVTSIQVNASDNYNSGSTFDLYGRIA